MKRLITSYFLFSAITCFFQASAASFITYELSDGRFGDHLLAYCHAKWISYRHGIPLLYRPFKYSNELFLHYEELSYTEVEERSEVFVNNQENIDTQASVLYRVPFFPESPLEICLSPFDSYFFAVDWKDPEFKRLLQFMIYPINESYLQPLDLPPDYVSVALHVRKGTYFDRILGVDVKDLTDWNKGPLLFKIPPDSYYIDQLKMIADRYKKPLYVYIFTDHPSPEELALCYKSHLSNYPILFDYRRDENRQDLNVLEDFFTMIITPFSCLIRPESHFSFVASKLGNYEFVVSPRGYYYQENNAAIINEVNLEIT